MIHKSIIETTGSITKVEILSSLEENILSGTLVLKTIKPFPGYSNAQEDVSLSVTSQSFYLITMYRYFSEKLERIARALKEDDMIECCSSFGEIVIQNKILPCIRLKRLKSNRQIIDIQKFYNRNDIKFMPYKYFLSEGKIKVFKHFKIVEIFEGIYRDLNEGEKFYINIPVQLNWKLFEHLVFKVKSKIINTNFDSALGIINRYSGPEDVIRIYDKNITLERALEIKKYFLKEVKNEKLLLTNIIGSMDN